MYLFISDSVQRMCKKKIEDLAFKAAIGIEDYDVNYEKIDLLQSVINNIIYNENSYIRLKVDENVVRAINNLHSKGYTRKEILLMYYSENKELDDLRFITSDYYDDWIIDCLGGMFIFDDEEELLN